MRTFLTLLALTVALAASGGCAYHYGERGGERGGDRCERRDYGYGREVRVDHYGGYRGDDHHDRGGGYGRRDWH